MATATATPIHSLFLSSSPTSHNRSAIRLTPRFRPVSVKASSAVSAPPAAPPTLTTSPTGIVLIEPEEKEKVHRLKLAYEEKVVPILKEEFSYTNVHQIPKVEKITVNCGIGDAQQNSKGLEAAMKHLAMITGQRPVKTIATKSVASFKVRQGYTVGIACTLRGKYMYSFLDRLINLGLPRTADFQGVKPGSFDGNGNYALGLTDQGAFPELENMGKQKGMDVCITTTAKTDQEAKRLLTLLGMPFREPKASELVVRKKKRLKQHHFQSKGQARGGRRKK